MKENTERQLVVQSVEAIIQSQADLSSDLRISSEDINDAYINHSAKFAYWSVVAAQAKIAVDKKKLEVERQDEYMKKTLLGELDASVRRKLNQEGERVTEARVTAGIYSHSRYQEEQDKLYALQDELLELQGQYSLLYAAKEAMNHRKDMLVSLGAQLRQEGDNGDVYVKSK